MKAVFERARKALDFLERHQLEPTPRNYDFALRYITDPASDLARDVVVHTEGGVRLTADTMAALVARHGIETPAMTPAVERRERTVARQAEELGSLTSDAHDLTQALGRDVGAIASRAEHWPSEGEAIVARLSDAERELADLRRDFAQLRDDIAQAHERRTDRDRDELTQGLSQDGARHILGELAEFNRTYVLMLFSIDDLVGINRRFGSGVGDNVINAFAQTLRHGFPEEDLIRWTGNEFIVVSTHIAMAAAREAAEEALAAFRSRRLKLRGTGEWIGTVTASAGIVTAQGRAEGDVLERARGHLGDAAIAGGGRVHG
ncbi:MAG: diguanylate cyclase [Sphingomonas taxi]